MKQKNKAKNSHRRKYYFALVLALVIVFIYWAAARVTLQFPLGLNFRAGDPMFYPASLMIQSPQIRTEVQIIFAALFTGCILFAKFSGVAWIPTIITFLIGAGILLPSALFSGLSAEITPVQTLVNDDYQYHLIGVWDYIEDSSPDEIFIILKCDSPGLMCEYYSTPTRTSAQNSEGQLLLDEGVLYLQVGDERYLASDDYFTRRDRNK